MSEERLFTQAELDKIIGERLSKVKHDKQETLEQEEIINNLKAQIEQMELEQQTKAENAKLDKLLETALNGCEFVNEYTRQGVREELKHELSKGENKGKNALDIYYKIIDNKNDIFKSLNSPPIAPPPQENSRVDTDKIRKAFFDT